MHWIKRTEKWEPQIIPCKEVLYSVYGIQKLIKCIYKLSPQDILTYLFGIKFYDAETSKIVENQWQDLLTFGYAYQFEQVQ